MPNRPSPTFPKILARLWSRTDPGSQTLRTSDALDEPTPHRKLTTSGGNYWVCSQTGQLERIGPDTDLSEGYDAHWQRRVADGHPDVRAKQDARELLKQFDDCRTHGRMFEVGSGLGAVLEAARDLGWQPDGVEFSPFAVQNVRERCGIDVRVGAVESIALGCETYDLVIMDNIFEHLFEPRRVLDKLARSLRPGGLMYLQTLNAECYSLKTNPDHWLYYGGGHLFIPTLTSFGHYLKHADLEIVWMHTKGYHLRPAQQHAKRMRGVAGSYQKIVSNIAKITRHGHRLECVLRRTE